MLFRGITCGSPIQQTQTLLFFDEPRASSSTQNPTVSRSAGAIVWEEVVCGDCFLMISKGYFCGLFIFLITVVTIKYRWLLKLLVFFRIKICECFTGFWSQKTWFQDNMKRYKSLVKSNEFRVKQNVFQLSGILRFEIFLKHGISLLTTSTCLRWALTKRPVSK